MGNGEGLPGGQVAGRLIWRWKHVQGTICAVVAALAVHLVVFLARRAWRSFTSTQEEAVDEPPAPDGDEVGGSRSAATRRRDCTCRAQEIRTPASTAASAAARATSMVRVAPVVIKRLVDSLRGWHVWEQTVPV